MSTLRASKPTMIVAVLTNRWTRYIVLCGIANSVIWGASLSYLKTAKPTYTSAWALILPGASFGVNFNLPDIGQASSSNGSGMGSSQYDPRANYQYIFTSDPVIQSAAKKAKLPANEFGKPRIKLLDNTTMMEFQITGSSPSEAQKKSWAMYNALVEELNAIRDREISQRQAPTEKTLLSAQKKLEQAQINLSNYKMRSGLSFPERLSNLSVNIEQLRRLRTETLAQAKQSTQRVQKLSADLGLSSKQAADAFLLQSDQIFQQNLKDYSEATASLDVLMAKYGPQHPKVIAETQRQRSAASALSQRGPVVLGRAVTLSQLIQLSLTTSGAGRDPLFQDLVSFQAEQRGLQAQVQALDQQIPKLEKELDTLAQRQSVLDNLERDAQIAEAVFASTLAKLDLTQGDPYSAYPLVQMAVEPSLPDSPTTPKKTIILAGAAIGSVLATLGLTLMWIRKPWFKKIYQLISP